VFKHAIVVYKPAVRAIIDRKTDLVLGRRLVEFFSFSNV
jgi:hypothetical protein